MLSSQRSAAPNPSRPPAGVHYFLWIGKREQFKDERAAGTTEEILKTKKDTNKISFQSSVDRLSTPDGQPVQDSFIRIQLWLKSHERPLEERGRPLEIG